MNELLDTAFTDWLEGDPSASEDGCYRHRRLNERPELRPEILYSLRSFVEKAHEDARRHLREVAGISLDPLQQPPTHDPVAGYPALLHMNTLKEYFGEVLTGLICEHFAPHDEDEWRVPAYLFRFHVVAFQELERIRQTGQAARTIPGRTGADCLAFVRDSHGRIIRTLCCEAKCTADHQSGMVRKAHEQLSDPLLLPVDLPQIIEVLEDRGSPEASEWVEALRQLWLDDPDDSYERCDLVSYTCGRRPVRKSSWIQADRPHTRYSGGRRLEAVEIHLDGVEGLIGQIYGREIHVSAT